MEISSEILEKMDGSRCDGSTGGHYPSLFEGRIKKVVARAFTERPLKIDWDSLGCK